MTVLSSVPTGEEFERQLADADPEMLRLMVKSFAEALMSTAADAACGASYGQSSPERTNSRSGIARVAGTRGSGASSWRSRSCVLARTSRSGCSSGAGGRAVQALMNVVATAYLLGVSTRRVERLAAELGVTQLSKPQVSAMATHLDEQVRAFRERLLDAGPYSVIWVDALTQKVRENGRVVDVGSAEDGAGWLAFLRSLTARGLSGVQLVISDAHRGLVEAVGAAVPGAAWQRCRAHYSRNLANQVPESAQPWVPRCCAPSSNSATPTRSTTKPSRRLHWAISILNVLAGRLVWGR